MLKLDLHPPQRILRQFAYAAVIGLPLLTAVVLRFSGAFHWTHPAMLIALGVGVVQLVLFLAKISQPTWLVYVVITLIGFPIGFLISHILMAVIYYLLITPIGLVFRLVGRDALGRKLEPNRASYWHDRGPPRSPSSYFKLY